MPKYVQQSGQPPGLIGDQNQHPQSSEALAQKSRELAEKAEARKQMLASHRNLKSGYGYAETLRVIMTDPQAKMAYAMADIVGLGSNAVETMGYVAFVNHVLDGSVNETSLGIWRSKIPEINAITDKTNPDAQMLKFARAMSAIAGEAFSGLAEKFSEANQAPVMYVLTGQHAKSAPSRHELMAHAVECAGSERDLRISKALFTMRATVS